MSVGLAMALDLDERDRAVREVQYKNRNQCYVVSEALYHMLGGKKAGWTPVVVKLEVGGTHWYLRHKSGFTLDATASQFIDEHIFKDLPGRGSGFLTKKPSKKAKALIKQLTR